MAYTTIDDGSAHFLITLYTGDGNDDRSITNDANAGDFKPDLIWAKQRNTTRHHQFVDSSRGITKYLQSSLTNAESTNANAIQAFETDGFQLGTDTDINQSSGTYVAWQWKSNGGTTTTNDASSTSIGTIDSVIQANTTAGFSIVTYTGNGSAGASWAHGLGAVPHWIIVKGRNLANDWAVYHHKNTSAPETDFVNLQSTDATSDSNTRWNDTAPTSTVITTGNNAAVNGNTYNYVSYVWTEIQGFSKFGRYTGNGNADGPFVYTGFKPKWLMIKRTNNTEHWKINDTVRDYNGQYGNDASLHPNQSIAETTSASLNVDFLSNGFKLVTADGASNAVDAPFIYMCFAEHPLVSSKGVPCTAR